MKRKKRNCWRTFWNVMDNPKDVMSCKKVLQIPINVFFNVNLICVNRICIVLKETLIELSLLSENMSLTNSFLKFQWNQSIEIMWPILLISILSVHTHTHIHTQPHTHSLMYFVILFNYCFSFFFFIRLFHTKITNFIKQNIQLLLTYLSFNNLSIACKFKILKIKCLFKFNSLSVKLSNCWPNRRSIASL